MIAKAGKNGFLDYKSAALPTELCRQNARPARTHAGSERGKLAQSLVSNNQQAPRAWKSALLVTASAKSLEAAQPFPDF
jgi:hypothetical protein